MKRCMRYLFFAFLFLISNLTFAEKQAILVLDASGSMWGQISGKAKISIAREVVADMLQDWSDEDKLGLVAYGHRRKGDCQDIENVLPVATVDPELFSQRVNKLNPKGKTPMSDAVKIAAESLRYTEEQATVILVSDGKETCHADPCALAAELEKTGVDFTTHVIGFDVKDETGLSQLKCLAENTGGTFATAANANELKSALTEAVKSTQSAFNLKVNTVLTAAGELASVDWIYIHNMTDDGQKGEQVRYNLGGGGKTAYNLPPGKYIVVASDKAVQIEQAIEIKEDEVLQQEIVLNAGYINASAVPVPNAESMAVDWFYVNQNSQQILQALGGSGQAWFLAPAGELVVQASKGPVSASKTITLEAGQTLDVPIALNAGKVAVKAVLTAGGETVPVEWFYAYGVDAAGKETEISHALGGSGTATFTLGEGTYLIKAWSRGNTVTASQEISIIPSQTINAEINLNAGYINTRSIPTAGAEPTL